MRTEYDLEMLREIGFCNGIENYSRHLSGESLRQRPWCLIDFFPDDFLLFIDESHVTIPQIGGMYHGDLSRKQKLVDFGFRLPSALDNRPLKPDEFEKLTGQTIFVSATPASAELEKSSVVMSNSFAQLVYLIRKWKFVPLKAKLKTVLEKSKVIKKEVGFWSQH